jgi:hypothetical protein
MSQPQAGIESEVESKGVVPLRPGDTLVAELPEANEFRTVLAELFQELVHTGRPKGPRGERIRKVASAVGIEVKKHTKFDIVANRIRTKLEQTGLTAGEIDLYMKTVE